MSIRFGPTPEGGRLLEGNTPYGRFVVEWDKRGWLVRQQMKPLDPAGPASADTGKPTGPAQPCQGCGGAKYRPNDFNRPGGADELIQQMG